MAIAALVVSVCAVGVSIYEAALQRQHARAEAWPHVELEISVSSEMTQISVVNSDLGPAAIVPRRFVPDDIMIRLPRSGVTICTDQCSTTTGNS